MSKLSCSLDALHKKCLYYQQFEANIQNGFEIPFVSYVISVMIFNFNVAGRESQCIINEVLKQIRIRIISVKILGHNNFILCTYLDRKRVRYITLYYLYLYLLQYQLLIMIIKLLKCSDFFGLLRQKFCINKSFQVHQSVSLFILGDSSKTLLMRIAPYW